jgi:hypothetical protein
MGEFHLNYNKKLSVNLRETMFILDDLMVHESLPVPLNLLGRYFSFLSSTACISFVTLSVSLEDRGDCKSYITVCRNA